MKFTKVQLKSKVEQQYPTFRLFTKSAQPIFHYTLPPLSLHNWKFLIIDSPKEQILDCLFK